MTPKKTTTTDSESRDHGSEHASSLLFSAAMDKTKRSEKAMVERFYSGLWPCERLKTRRSLRLELSTQRPWRSWVHVERKTLPLEHDAESAAACYRDVTEASFHLRLPMLS